MSLETLQFPDLIIGSTISHYRIVAKLGEGGMGVVYKAEDITLDRPVALKFLAEHLLNDTEAKERFLREAKAAAALHHPNVCPVYEIAEASGKTFIAMAFLDGESLEDRITKGPLPIKDALDIARQVAEGLDAAHENGIVHRDIKPANIIVDAKGHATIMDFGLARLTEASRLTKVDTAMGTVAYMSPEQAQGMEVDSRTDIWALGCVLYEMVAGQRPFQGQYDQALLYEIVHEEVAPLTSVRAGVPMELEFIVGECLAKDRDDRTGTAQEVSRKLRTLAEKLKSGRSTILRTGQMTGAVAVPASRTLNPAEVLPPDSISMKRRSKRALQAFSAVAALAFLGSLAVHFAEPQAERPVRRFSFSLKGLADGTISPDGRHIAFFVRSGEERSVWVRTLANESARPITAAEAVGRPGLAWSPDSRSVVFSTNVHLRRADIDAQSSTRICDLPGTDSEPFAGASWSHDGERIVFSSGQSLWEVAARGGEPSLLLETILPAGQFRYPQILPSPNDSRVVYAAGVRGGSHIEALDRVTGERTTVLDAGSEPFYAPSGHLLFRARDSGLLAISFSAETLRTVGEAFPVVEDDVSPSVSRDGTLVYTSRSMSGATPIEVRDRAGRLLRTVGDPVGRGDALEIAPDGRRIAATIDGDVWVFDLDRNLGTRLTSRKGDENRPRWISPDEISYSLETRALAAEPLDGAVEPVILLDSVADMSWFDWSSDGRRFVYTAGDPAGGEGGLWYRERRADGSLSEAVSFLRTPASENQPEISPDGRYVAYVSNETGRSEVYVRPFPAGVGKWRISSSGGGTPRWSSDGLELFYRGPQTTLMTTSFSGKGTVSVGEPKVLFEAEGFRRGGSGSIPYDVFPDGQRFALFGLPAEAQVEPAVHIIENWYEEFRDREK